jgi:predicted metal-dependent hydrolase
VYTCLKRLLTLTESHRDLRNITMQKLLTLAISTALVSLCASLSHAQEWQLPRTPGGHPDIQGIWTNKTLTPLTRPREFADLRALSPEQVERLENGHQDYLDAEYAPSNPDREAGSGAQAGNDGDTEDGYNEFWKDLGTRVQVINGEYRSSIVVDPPNGQIPYVGDFRSRFARDPAAPKPSDGPEGRPLAERCLLAFGSHSGPPMLPVMYNNNYQIVQTDDYVVILAEMAHDARIIRIDDELMPNMKKWMGDSVGHWEGDTLVVETAGFHPQQSFRGASEHMSVVERFQRVSDNEVLYTFTVTDPTVFETAWTGELMFNARPDNEPIYEYACHEGNYALPGILAGARQLEHLAAQEQQ